MWKSIFSTSYHSLVRVCSFFGVLPSVALAVMLGFSSSGDGLILQTSGNFDLSLAEQVDSLRKYADLVTHSEGKEKADYERLFFKYFPDTFDRFDSLYGYREISIDSFAYAPLFSSDHLERVFPHLKSVNDADYCRKLVGISIGGHWEADQVGLFQHNLINKVRANLGLTCSILRGLNDQQVKSFWLFFFDMENPSAMDFSFLRNVEDKRIIRLMKEAMRIDRVKWSNE